MLFIVGSQLCGCVCLPLWVFCCVYLVWKRFICASQQPARAFASSFISRHGHRVPVISSYMRAKTKRKQNDACVASSATLRETSNAICAHFASIRRRDSQKWFFCHLFVFVFFITNFHFSLLLLMLFFSVLTFTFVCTSNRIQDFRSFFYSHFEKKKKKRKRKR